MTLNGPIIAIRNTADDSEWANYSSCVWTGKVADDIDWAHCCSRERLPMSLNGPMLFMRNAADDSGWAHSFPSEKLVNDIEWAPCCS